LKARRLAAALDGYHYDPFQVLRKRKIHHMNFRVEIEQEEDGRWIAEVVDLPGVLAYGSTSKEAQAKVQALALRVVADRLEHGEAGPDLVSISFAAA
jgi:predicted RNase H-like HicB family nuclease